MTLDPLNLPGDAPGTRLVADALGVPFVDLTEYAVSPGILRRLPTRTAIRQRCVPMVHNPRRAVFVVDDPARLAWLSMRRDLLGVAPAQKLEFALTTRDGIQRALARRLDGPE